MGAVTTAATIDFSGDEAGSYQTITLEGNTELTIDATKVHDSGYYGKIILDITAIGGTYNLTWDNNVNIKFDDEGESFWNRDTTETSTIVPGSTHIIELWSYQGSLTYFAKYVGSFN